MNAQTPTVDEFHWWREAVAAGRGVETEKGNVRSGYYRVKGEALAFWRDESGTLLCWRSGTKWKTPTLPDEIEDTFSFAAPHPVAYEAFTAFRECGRWPDEVEPIAAPDPSLPPSEALTAELDALREQANGWIKEIQAVKTQEQADKAANFSEAFAEIERRATETHKTEKAPHLEAGRKVDGTWKPIIERADSLKKWAKNCAAPFLIAEKKRIADEDAVRKAEAARIEREAMAARVHAARIGAPPPAEVHAPPIAPAPRKAVAGTAGARIAVRTRSVVEVTDWRAFLTWLSTQNDLPEDFRQAVEKQAKRFIDAGMNPPGVKTNNVESVA